MPCHIAAACPLQLLIIRLFPVHVPPQVASAPAYTASVATSPSTVVARQPAALTVTITRPAPLPGSEPLQLLTAWFPGEGTPPASSNDAAYSAWANVSLSLAPGTTSASFTATYTYPTAGTKAARVQAFVVGGTGVGLLGANSPALVSVTVRRNKL